jgi:hypothetical protein
MPYRCWDHGWSFGPRWVIGIQGRQTTVAMSAAHLPCPTSRTCQNSTSKCWITLPRCFRSTTVLPHDAGHVPSRDIVPPLWVGRCPVPTQSGGWGGEVEISTPHTARGVPSNALERRCGASTAAKQQGNSWTRRSVGPKVPRRRRDLTDVQSVIAQCRRAGDGRMQGKSSK